MKDELEMISLSLTDMNSMQLTATIFFTAAVLHTFLVKQFASFARHFRQGSIGENLFHFLGEVEVVFGIWASLFGIVWSIRFGTSSFVAYIETVNFTEATFVFVTMCLAATKPITYLATNVLKQLSSLLPFSKGISWYLGLMCIGPILGSFITEPAAMTITALLLRDSLFAKPLSSQLKYATLGALFVNISIGGTLSNFAAPPVVMVAHSWNWSSTYMFTHFGWKAIISIVLCSSLISFLFRNELSSYNNEQVMSSDNTKVPLWVSLVHITFITLTVLYSHHISFFLGIFLLFLGWASISQEYQDELRIRQSLLVGYFLAGLVTLGQLQAWWLKPALEGMNEYILFWGATALTAITDNAALTFLGTLVPSLSEVARYMLVAGAVTGGGLTVIANAPNPAGYSILSPCFGEDGISPLWLFIAALIPTIIAAAVFLLCPTL